MVPNKIYKVKGFNYFMINKGGGIALSLMIVAGVFVIGLFAGTFVIGDGIQLAPKEKVSKGGSDRFVGTNTSTGLPDLVAVSLRTSGGGCGISNISWSCGANLIGEVTNEGNKSARNFFISLDEVSLYNENIVTLFVSNLDSAESIRLNATYYWNGTGTNITSPTIRLFADSTQVVRELSERNNIRTIII